MTSRTFPASTVELVTARSETFCECMARGCTLKAVHCHHRRPRGMGSTQRPETNHASNCLHVCRRCHERIESMRNWALSNGFLVRQSDDPAAVPVWWRCADTSVLLDDAGNLIPTTARRSSTC